MIWKVAPALAVGITVIIKPAEQTPLTTLFLAEVDFDHFPPGVLNVITGDGTVGEVLVMDPRIPVIAFTGSTGVGQRIAGLAAGRMKRTHLELGGKDAFVIAPDADIELAVEAIADSSLINAGQVCTSTGRVCIPEQKIGAFSEALASFVSDLRLGPGIDSATDIGPMADEKYRIKVENHLADAQQRGARVVTGCRRPHEFQQGYYY